VVEISSGGEKIRAVPLKPAKPKGSVILFAGANGRLDITAAGDITKLRFNQLVRTLTIWKIANGNARQLDVPTLLVGHVADTCPHTSAATVPAFRTWYQSGGRRLAEQSFSGGLPAESEPCETRSPHGFWGLDPAVAGAITGWIGEL